MEKGHTDYPCIIENSFPRPQILDLQCNSLLSIDLLVTSASSGQVPAFRYNDFIKSLSSNLGEKGVEDSAGTRFWR